MSAKRISEPGSGPVAVEAAASVQPAAERRAAEAKLRALIDRFAPRHLRLIAAMRRALRRRLPTANELVYEYRAWFVVSFSPSERGHEGVLAIRADGNGVKLFVNPGQDLPDPAKLLRGAGRTRWIKVEDAKTLARPEVARLVEDVIARSVVPFETAGNGRVVVRSAGVKRPRGRRTS